MCGSVFTSGGIDFPLTYTMDDTKPDGTIPAIIGFILVDKARKLVTKTPEERRVLCARGLAKAFGDDEALEPIHYEEKNWLAEQYSGGCYTTMYPPGCLTQYARVMREPFGRIYFAGTETATKWSGYMDGAISSGERAAREILYTMGKITREKIWLEEPESQDVIARPFDTSFSEKYMPSVACAVHMIKLTTFLGVLAAGAYVFQRHRGYWQ